MTTARLLVPLVLIASLSRVSLAAAATAAPQVFAIIVANNKSHELDRPDLQFADDDGARYHRLLSNAGADAHALLLTSFDRATANLYPELSATTRPATRASLRAAVAEVSAAVAAAQQAGRQTVFYFVFAGHGGVAGGMGYLELEDARIDGTVLEDEIINRIAADVQHVILDSCNSFFVLNPRRPGGRRWATPRDMALGFAQRHPNVGLFLSTSAEAEVYEWSELESGIFSHEVRSGLTGAADADGDGIVTYGELAAFVERANERLPSESVRPRVFHRAPGGTEAAPLFASAQLRGRRVTIGPGERRIWLRGENGERLIDLHKEAPPTTVIVPGDPGAALTLVEEHREGSAARPTLMEYEVPAGRDAVDLLALEAHHSGAVARGGQTMFGRLFTLPYGPQAYAAFLVEQKQAPEPVFGISHADELRMRHYLTAISESDRSRRRATMAASFGTGALIAAGGVWYSEGAGQTDSATRRVVLWTGLGVGAVAALPGIVAALSVSPGERALLAFDRELTVPGASRANIVAGTELELDNVASRERFNRRVMQWSSTVMGAGALGLGTLKLALGETETPGQRGYIAVLFGVGLLNSAVAVAGWFGAFETPTERLLRLYRTDPDLESRSSLQIGFAPMPGGAAVGVSGHF